MKDIALYGSVMTTAQYAQWLDDLAAASIANEGLSPEEAAKGRAELAEKSVGAVPIIVTQTKDENFTLEGFLPEAWNGEYTTHLWRLDPTDALQLPFTHVACFVGTKIEGPIKAPFWFDGKRIEAQFAICLWDDKTGKYEYIHCYRCAVRIVEWIMDRQREWSVPAFTVDAKATHNAPTRLQ